MTEIGQPLYTKLDRQNLVYYTDGPAAAQQGFPAYAHDRQHLNLQGGLKVPALFLGNGKPVYGPTVPQVSSSWAGQSTRGPQRGSTPGSAPTAAWPRPAACLPLMGPAAGTPMRPSAATRTQHADRDHRYAERWKCDSPAMGAVLSQLMTPPADGNTATHMCSQPAAKLRRPGNEQHVRPPQQTARRRVAAVTANTAAAPARRC